ncbi:RNA-directed DNA polymerase, eukaryota, reverse transcriptase zinc-binding domain protein [Tanacetum coccineum]
MNRGFLDLGRRKNNHRKKVDTVLGSGLVTGLDEIMNDAIPLVDDVVAEDVVPSFMADENVSKEKASWFEEKMVLESYRSLPTQVTTMTGNTPDAKLENGPRFIQNNPLILKKWHLDENLLKEDVGTIPVWVKLHGVPVTDFSEDGLSAIATKLGTPLILDSYTSDICMQSWGRLSYARAMIELRADLELKDNIMMAMPKIAGEGHYTCNIHVEYEWKPLRCASYNIFGHIHEECLKNTDVEYRPVPKKPNVSSSDNKKKGVEPTIEVNNSNPFEVLNSVDNDVEFGTNGGTTNLVNNEANSSGPSFINVDNSSISTTSIIDKIRKFKDLLTSGQAILVDEASNPLKKVDVLGDYESEDEVALVDNDMARSLASERVGFGTQSLLEQWRDLYGNGDYDDDPYDDDTYEGQDLPQEIQAICDNLDIRVRGRDMGPTLIPCWELCIPDIVLLRIFKSQENRQKGQTRTQERKSEQEPGIQSQNQKKSSLQSTLVNRSQLTRRQIPNVTQTNP